MNLDPTVRFATILDNAGIIFFGGHREETQNYLLEDDQKNP